MTICIDTHYKYIYTINTYIFHTIKQIKLYLEIDYERSRRQYRTLQSVIGTARRAQDLA